MNKDKKNMKKYKVEFIQTKTFVVDVLAKDEQEARDKATEKFAEIKANRTEHYNQTGDSVEETNKVFDVSNTDDPFNP